MSIALTYYQCDTAEAGTTFSISDAVEDGPDGFQAVTEHVTTIAEEVERSQQATLMRRFKIAVTVYMIAFVAAFFVPAYGEDKDESQVILALWNALLLLFLLSLAWVFRTRDEANPYMFVGEDEARNVHLDTRVRHLRIQTTNDPAALVLQQMYLHATTYSVGNLPAFQ